MRYEKSESNQGNDFTIHGYSELLSGFLETGYTVSSLQEAPEVSQSLFLRHDVDFSAAYCLPVADVESKLGVCATYYFLVSSPFYNVAEPTTRHIIRRLVELGHEIGLHFDSVQFDEDFESAEAAAFQEVGLLEQASGQPVRSISFHRPAPALLGRSNDFARRPHTYQPRYFQDLHYVSDSTGEWRYGHPFSSPAFKRRASMQLLTHPIWWHLTHAEPPRQRLLRFIDERQRKLLVDVCANTGVSLS